MYYRYKSKKRSKKVYEVALIAALVAAVFVTGYHFRAYLVFWKYSYNSFESRIDKAARIADPIAKKEHLIQLSAKSDKYMDDNPLSPDAFLLGARVHLLLGEAYQEFDFNQCVINGLPTTANERALTEFTSAVKLVKKCRALSSRRKLSSAGLITMAKAGYYSGMYSNTDLFQMMSQIRDASEMVHADDARFYSIIQILGGHPDEGIAFFAVKRGCFVIV